MTETIPVTRSGQRAAATQAARPPQSYPARIDLFDPERVHQVDDVSPERNLLPTARGRSVAEARAAVTPEVRDDDPEPRVSQQRRDVDVAVDVVWEAVEQHHRAPVGRAGVVVGDVEDARLDVAQRFQPLESIGQRGRSSVSSFVGSLPTRAVMSQDRAGRATVTVRK